MALPAGMATTASMAADWPGWRGPGGDGKAGPDASPPLRWSEEESVRWRAEIPGRGLSSPVATGLHVYLTTATEDAQYVLAIRRDNGDLAWRTEVHRGSLPERLHRKNSPATPTVASDGERVYAVFHNGERIHLTALDLAGEVLWQRDTGPFACDYRFGYAPSPALHDGLLYIASEFEEDGYLAAFRSEDGGEVWRVPRRIKTSYSSPVVATVSGREQLIISGGELVSSYDPKTGALLWEAEAGTKATCGTAVWSDSAVFVSGGFPNRETAAVLADGSGRVLWRVEDKSYEQSLLYHDGHVYAFNDNGIAVCWNAETGEERWKERLGGPVSASPVLVGDRIYATNEQGETFVFRADPERFEKLAEMGLGDEGFASLAVVGGRVYLRTAKHVGETRQELLYCLEGDS